MNQTTKPTEQAVKAAAVICHPQADPKTFRGVEEIIDRATGLPDLLAENQQLREAIVIAQADCDAGASKVADADLAGVADGLADCAVMLRAALADTEKG